MGSVVKEVCTGFERVRAKNAGYWQLQFALEG